MENQYFSSAHEKFMAIKNKKCCVYHLRSSPIPPFRNAALTCQTQVVGAVPTTLPSACQLQSPGTKGYTFHRWLLLPKRQQLRQQLHLLPSVSGSQLPLTTVCFQNLLQPWGSKDHHPLVIDGNTRDHSDWVTCLIPHSTGEETEVFSSITICCLNFPTKTPSLIKKEWKDHV